MSRGAARQPPRGARSQGQGPRAGSRLRAWGRHHRAMSLDSARRLLRHPVGSLLTMLAIAIALVLPAALWLALDSARLLDAELEESATLTVYLAHQVDEAQAGRIDEAIAAHEGVARTRLITAAEGMAEFQQALGLADALGRLDDNPLPASVVVTPVDPAPEAVRELAESLQDMTGVDEVRLDLAWLERLRHLAELGSRVALALGVLFGLGVLLVVGNTIRLAVESRRREIEVVMLIGATHAFVRRPFLYSGAWYGLGGGLLAWGLLGLGSEWLAAPVSALAASYGATFRLPQLGAAGSATLLICSTLLGWLGAWIAVSRHLAEIRPR
ncbi:permease-like cell division protein FtsX [Halomonas chromatireducens]|uniref:Cell division protein FtsX n=1 Tax=Halomonas chromatireducens TaxID=507626 RepID=A0A125R0I5_9GAMM|nr:permease-like cell division protein FtsX [Halomonas chromatireducens]AMD02061.1 Cell division protein FtsX [Halomonas chromatireducens]